jgi:hypothetical protein
METVHWYKAHHQGAQNLLDRTRSQISAYSRDAQAARLSWAD